ncbi:MAG: hypothetical protein Q7S22_07550 [Candidatus Micrarchaeota archaeon]|nr:hypothetical protein [Candidatus Micrarchaeota archaeon]
MKLSENAFREIQKILLKKLYKLGCWGKGHVSENNMPKGFPPHLRGLVLDVAHELRKQEFLVMRPSGHDKQWYLNFAKRIEIENIIKEEF